MRFPITTVALLFAAAFTTGTAQTNTTSPVTQITHTILQRYPLPQLPGWELRLVYAEFAPGARSPLHNHPVPGLGYVIEGEVISGWEDGNIEHYPVGTSFMDLAGNVHVVAGNSDTENPLRFLISYVIPIEEANIHNFVGGN